MSRSLVSVVAVEEGLAAAYEGKMAGAAIAEVTVAAMPRSILERYEARRGVKRNMMVQK